MTDPITYLVDGTMVVGTFVWPGRVTTNPNASGVLSVKQDWITANGINWTITLGGTPSLTFYPSQFQLNGEILSAWVAFNPSVANYGAYTVTAVRGFASTSLTRLTSGFGGTLGMIDMNDPDYGFIPLSLQGGLQGIATKASSLWRNICYVAGALITIFLIYKAYRMIKG
jgi:hypothetical protein